MNNNHKEDMFKDPAKNHPFLRLIVRYGILLFLLLLALLIPTIVFYVVSILFHLHSTLGTILGLASFVLYLYVLWKKELWNLIRR